MDFINARTFLYGYLLVLTVHLLSFGPEWYRLHLVSKMLLMPLLLAYAAFQQGKITGIRTLLILALLLSWAGDGLLLLSGEGFFIFGLTAFLLAHISYIRLFRVLQNRDGARTWKTNVWILVLIYSILLMAYLLPGLGNLTVPVLAYGLVISLMLIMAVHALPPANPQYKLLIAGAGLFVVSDSLLALAKFKAAFPLSGLWIMLTYGTAQWLITYAIINHGLSKNMR